MENTTRYEILDQQTMSNCKIITNGYNRLFKAWTLSVLHGIGLSEPVRFNELKRRIPNISSSSLSDRLSDLVDAGIITRTVTPGTPPSVHYSFSEKGRELRAILGDLDSWIVRWEK
ncbi:MAG: winged helix-turn-helix transcriptional regulator [Thermoplasmataceae archaeon]|jgi:DNA-binding HxlR family transcriptional regulator